MPHIVLTEEQMRIITEADGPVDVRGPQGQPVASMSLLTPEDLEAIERHRRTRGERKPGIPGHRVQAFLQKLGEIAEREGIDEAKVQEVLRRLRAGEPL